MNVKKLHWKAVEQYNAKNYDAALKILTDLKKSRRIIKKFITWKCSSAMKIGQIDKTLSLIEEMMADSAVSTPREKYMLAKSFVNSGAYFRKINMY